ncbi:MAG: EAL domain-containing protein [Deltaproteobacteria bacterium]|nr:EAL domain-containing protein [Deltaproteobacteria bacterium]
MIKTAKILIVDDDSGNRMLIRRSLEKAGFLNFIEAENGRDALALIKTTPLDLVLLDIMMPDIDGHAVLEQMKADPALRDIPVIMITALDDMDSAVKCISLGAEEYLVKPFNPVMMKARVSATLEKKYLRDVERQYLKNYDPYTGLPNRDFFIHRLDEEAHRYLRSPSLFAILYIKIDKYDTVSASLGKKTADEYLIARCETIAGMLSEDTFLARFTDNVFALLLYDLKSSAKGDMIAYNINQALSRSMRINGHDISGKTSIGVVYSDPSYKSADQMLRNAELAATRVARLGGIRLYDEVMHEEAMRRLDMEPELRKAIHANQLILHYQPIVGLKDRRVIGFEALVRWMHPQKGMIPPDQFIQLAEDTGLILPIGGWVMEEACRQAAHWGRRLDRSHPLTISINISAYQLAEADFMPILLNAMEKSRVENHRIKLELTESAMIENPEHAESILGQVKDLDVKTSLDDFGTGYCALSYLLKYPFDTLKLDQSLIRQIDGKPRSREIVASTIHMAHQLGMDVVAEGVEDPHQVTALLEMGCDYGQGHLFNHPLSQQEADMLLA